mgnify:CR=1 FL=1
MASSPVGQPCSWTRQPACAGGEAWDGSGSPHRRSRAKVVVLGRWLVAPVVAGSQKISRPSTPTSSSAGHGDVVCDCAGGCS